jgi:hypothetical protein
VDQDGELNCLQFPDRTQIGIKIQSSWPAKPVKNFSQNQFFRLAIRREKNRFDFAIGNFEDDKIGMVIISVHSNPPFYFLTGSAPCF